VGKDHNRPMKKTRLRIATPQDTPVHDRDLHESQLLIWLRDVVLSHDALMLALRELLSSYTQLLTAEHAPDQNDRLLKVQGVLRNAELLRVISRRNEQTHDSDRDGCS
jgi:hypothetical protein